MSMFEKTRKNEHMGGNKRKIHTILINVTNRLAKKCL
jgi:hypothetical protein